MVGIGAGDTTISSLFFKFRVIGSDTLGRTTSRVVGFTAGDTTISPYFKFRVIGTPRVAVFSAGDVTVSPFFKFGVIGGDTLGGTTPRVVAPRLDAPRVVAFGTGDTTTSAPSSVAGVYISFKFTGRVIGDTTISAIYGVG
jgi:hypothetical protein